MLHLWLGITRVAIFFDITITVGTSRLTLGWYFGRFGTLISSSTMMFVYLDEITARIDAARARSTNAPERGS